MILPLKSLKKWHLLQKWPQIHIDTNSMTIHYQQNCPSLLKGCSLHQDATALWCQINRKIFSNCCQGIPISIRSDNHLMQRSDRWRLVLPDAWLEAGAIEKLGWYMLVAVFFATQIRTCYKYNYNNNITIQVQSNTHHELNYLTIVCIHMP